LKKENQRLFVKQEERQWLVVLNSEQILYFPILQSKWLLLIIPVLLIPIGLAVHEIPIPLIFLSLCFSCPVFSALRCSAYKLQKEDLM
jgi:hypothetical protein